MVVLPVCNLFVKSVPPDYTLNIQNVLQASNINNSTPPHITILYSQLPHYILCTIRNVTRQVVVVNCNFFKSTRDPGYTPKISFWTKKSNIYVTIYSNSPVPNLNGVLTNKHTELNHTIIYLNFFIILILVFHLLRTSFGLFS